MSLNIQTKLALYSTLFVDTAPVIYFIEHNSNFFKIVEAVFATVDSGQIQIFTSPITLAECLIFPIKQNSAELEKNFRELIVGANNTNFIETTEAIGICAAKLRVKYNLSLTDAIQIATAIESNCEAFLTNDVQLKRVNEIDILVLQEFNA